MTRNPRLISFYLPQFHPIPENDLWWGKGFTEWRNVVRANPLFTGHYQPHIPSELGFYDLRLKDIMHEQISLASEYGINGFCFHYYWFSGKKLLFKPIEDFLNDQNLSMPFCLCWANENWTRRWDAAEHEILIEQKYSDEDAEEFIKSLEPYIKDSRYIRHQGKPLIIVYRPQQIPKPQYFTNIWRRYCRDCGIGEIYLAAALTHGNTKFKSFGFDCGVEFPPHNAEPTWRHHNIDFYDEFRGGVCDYSEIANLYLSRTYEENPVYRTVFPSWDNTARRKDRSIIVKSGTPGNYERWLSATIENTKKDPLGSTFVFINAWNEWAEGCHLEPDLKFGRKFLEATKIALSGKSRYLDFPDQNISANNKTQAEVLIRDIFSVTKKHIRIAKNRSRALSASVKKCVKKLIRR